MLKNNLIAKVSELETKLSNSESKINDMLRTASNLLYWKDKPSSYFSNTSSWLSNTPKIQNINELFYEIWKLVEFRDNILEQRWYDRQQQDNIHHMPYVKYNIF